MDPPYEIKTDYAKAVETLIKAHKKFANATYALWYPVVERHRIQSMEKAFIDSGIRNIQLFELGIAKDGRSRHDGQRHDCDSSAVEIDGNSAGRLAFLSERLGGARGHYRAEQLVPE